MIPPTGIITGLTVKGLNFRTTATAAKYHKPVFYIHNNGTTTKIVHTRTCHCIN